MMGARSILGCLLGLILVFGSVMGAVARKEQAGLATVALCGTDGAVVQIDAAGNPVPGGHGCPDCVAAAAVAILATQRGALALALARVGSVAFHKGVAARQPDGLTAVARGPPDWV